MDLFAGWGQGKCNGRLRDPRPVTINAVAAIAAITAFGTATASSLVEAQVAKPVSKIS